MEDTTMADKMRIYDDLKEMVEEEIDKIVKKDNMDEKCLEWLDKLVDIAKDIDTIYAMHNGHITGKIKREDATEENVLAMAMLD